MVRSIFCIFISCIKNIIDSNKIENQIIIAPPDKESIENLDQTLRIPIAHNFFWNYLEQMDSMQEGKSIVDKNNFTLLSLYTDIRFYDTEIRAYESGHKLRKSKFKINRSEKQQRQTDFRNTFRISESGQRALQNIYENVAMSS